MREHREAYLALTFLLSFFMINWPITIKIQEICGPINQKKEEKSVARYRKEDITLLFPDHLLLSLLFYIYWSGQEISVIFFFSLSLVANNQNEILYASRLLARRLRLFFFHFHSEWAIPLQSLDLAHLVERK